MNIFLETPRLILRQFTENDVDQLVALDSDPEVMRFINGGISSSYDAIAEQFLPYTMSYYDQYENLGFWAIVEKSSHQFIGWLFLRPEADFQLLQQLNLAESDAVELGYRLRKVSWGKGYMTEAAQALLDKTFAESEFNKINAWALAENKASWKVMEKLGLKRQVEYVVTVDMLTDTDLTENSLVQNLLNRSLVKYQLDKDD